MNDLINSHFLSKAQKEVFSRRLSRLASHFDLFSNFQGNIGFAERFACFEQSPKLGLQQTALAACRSKKFIFVWMA